MKTNLFSIAQYAQKEPLPCHFVKLDNIFTLTALLYLIEIIQLIAWGLQPVPWTMDGLLPHIKLWSSQYVVGQFNLKICHDQDLTTQWLDAHHISGGDLTTKECQTVHYKFYVLLNIYCNDNCILYRSGAR